MTIIKDNSLHLVHINKQHQPVLIAEVIENLAIVANGYYVDGTFGRGGHSRAILQILNAEGRLLALDRDPEAIAAGKNLVEMDNRLELVHTNFSNLGKVIHRKGWIGKVNGIILDLGVSSPQLEDPQRGFSFLYDGPLDMRMNTHSSDITAAQWLANAPMNAISQILYSLGEERYARRIAHAIVRERQLYSIKTTKQLADIIAKANPAWELNKHPATRSFMAIRIHINKELEELALALQAALDVLNVGGHLLVVSFHSLEDRIVKQFFKKQSRSNNNLPRGIPVLAIDTQPQLRLLTKVIRPQVAEVEANPRARSAMLRVAEKLR